MMLGDIVWVMPVLDIAAVVIAVASITVAIIETRRNNRTSLSLIEASKSFRKIIDKNDSECFQELSLILRNNGLPLHDVKAAITFQGLPPNTGTYSIGLRETAAMAATPAGRELAKGMIVTYRLRSDELDDPTKAMLRLLRSPRHQHARLSVFSQDYLAYTIRIGGWWDQGAGYWNQWIHLANRCMERRIGKNREGQDVVEQVIYIEPRRTLEFPIRQFIKSLGERTGSADT